LRVAVSFGIAGVLGCWPSFPDNVLYEGEHLEYAATVDVRVCEGSFHVQDAFAAELARVIGAEIREPIRFGLVDDSEIYDYCALVDEDEFRGIKGCYYFERAYSISPVSYHEIAHAVHDLELSGPTVFQEGFAQVYGTGRTTKIDRVDVRLPLKEWTGRDGFYYTIGLFVRFLIEEYGLAPLLTFMSETDYDDCFDDFAPVFEEVYGVTLESVMTAFEAYPSCTEFENRIALLECGLEPVAWEGDYWQTSAEVECGRDDVQGPDSDGPRQVMWTVRGLVVEETGEYELTAVGAPEAWSYVRLTRCGSCWDASSIGVEVSASIANKLVVLSAGTYHVAFSREVEQPGTVALRIDKK
jgi:hypothetical protein